MNNPESIKLTHEIVHPLQDRAIVLNRKDHRRPDRWRHPLTSFPRLLNRRNRPHRFLKRQSYCNCPPRVGAELQLTAGAERWLIRFRSF